MVRCLWARVPAMTLPPNTTHTSHAASSVATSRLWYRLSLASVNGAAMGCWEPVSTMGLEPPCSR